MFLILQHKSGGNNVYINPRLIEIVFVSVVNEEKVLEIQLHQSDLFKYKGNEFDIDDFLWQLGDVDV